MLDVRDRYYVKPHTNQKFSAHIKGLIYPAA